MTTDLTTAISLESRIQSKRVNLINVKLVKETSVLYKNRKIDSSTNAVELIRSFIESSDREQLILCCLDTKNQPIAIHIVSMDSLNSSIAYPSGVFKSSILSNATSIIIFRNYPSGNSAPSSENLNITSRLKEAGKIIGIEITRPYNHRFRWSFLQF